MWVVLFQDPGHWDMAALGVSFSVIYVPFNRRDMRQGRARGRYLEKGSLPGLGVALTR